MSRLQKTEHKESEDVLYWKTRALNRELVGIYDNVQSCLLALRDIRTLAKQYPEDEEEIEVLLTQIRERASLTLKAIEESR